MKKVVSVFNTGNDVDVVNILKKIALDIATQLEKGKKPEMTAVKESVDNAIYSSKLGYFVPGDKVNTMRLDATSIKKMTRMFFMAEMLIENLMNGNVMTMREAYYKAKGVIKSNPKLKPLDFLDQSESDAVISELCAMIESYREDLNVVANEKSGLTFCNGLIVEETLPDGSKAVVDLSSLGTSPYIPKNRPQMLKLKIKKGAKIDFVLAIESEGSATSLVSNGFLKRHNACIVALGGQPSMGTRGWLKKIQDQLKVPIYVFTDLDAYSQLILRAIKAGAGNSLLRSKDYSAPSVKYLGVLPSDIEKYGLDAYTINEKDPKEARALKKIDDILKTDPFFKDKKNKKFRDVLITIQKGKFRCEQQSYLGYKTDSKISGMEIIIMDKIKRKDWIE